MGIARTLLCLSLALLSAPEIPSGVWPQFDTVAHQLAKGGRERECKQLFGLLGELGMPKATLDKLQSSCQAELKKAGKPSEAMADAGKRLKAAVRQIAPLLAKSSEEEKAKLAKLLLEFDDSLDEAHAALGDSKEGEEWTTPEKQATRQHRAEILEALDKAMALAIPVESGPSEDALLVELNGQPGSFARYGSWTLQSSLTEVRTKRVLVETLRAEAFSSWLRGRNLVLPAKPSKANGMTFYLLDQQVKYEKAVEHAKTAGDIKPENAEAYLQYSGFEDEHKHSYRWSAFESHLETSLLCDITSARASARTVSLMGGHLNWVCMAVLGDGLPNQGWTEGESSRLGADTHVDNPADRARRDELMKFAKAGILGCRAWMAYLAEHNADPKWENSFVDELGKLTGEDLLKSTSMVEYLQELGLLRDVLNKLYQGKATEQVYESMTRSLGMPVTEFEARWRAWIAPRKTGLAQALDKSSQKSFAPDALAALARLNEVRKLAFKGRVNGWEPLELERGICDGARKHAEYLEQNPEQATKWPDAHEEYRDKPGYTPEGHWAGNHSNVIGTSDPKAAIDGWLGTFYHRVPMLTPELLRIGWGQSGKTAALDVESFVTPPGSEWVLPYPFDGMSDVPVHFSGPELPNPVPEEPDQDFGYPITLQLGLASREEPTPELTLSLSEAGAQVECWSSSPSQPSNPFVVPANTWCLIPKRPLKPGTSYSVSAEWTSTKRKLAWSFKTGK